MIKLIKKLDQKLLDFFSDGKPRKIAELIYKIITVNDGYGFKIFQKPLYYAFNFLLNKQMKNKNKHDNN